MGRSHGLASEPHAAFRRSRRTRDSRMPRCDRTAYRRPGDIFLVPIRRRERGRAIRDTARVQARLRHSSRFPARPGSNLRTPAHRFLLLTQSGLDEATAPAGRPCLYRHSARNAGNAAMALSVIVTSYESPGTLRLRLRSLVTQGEAREIVVSDCSTRQPARFLQTEFPGVRFLQFDEVRSVPQLRWAALP